MAGHCTWLHLSDCHFVHGSSRYMIDQQMVLGLLADDVALQVSEGHVPRPDFIVVTGDIANSGAAIDANEYGLARTWLLGLAERVEVEAEALLFVPGNHDANRGNDHSASTKRLLDCLRRLGDAVDEAVGDDEERTLLAARFSAYFQELVAPLGGPSSTAEDCTQAWSYDFDLDGAFGLRFVGLNTALLAADDDDQGRLQLGNGQLRELIGERQDPAMVTVALTHHPLDWLYDATEAEAWFHGRVHIHLSGHLHEARASHVSHSDGDERVHLQAGATHGDEGGACGHGYSFGHVEVSDDGVVRVTYWPRIWTPVKQWRTDRDRLPDDATSATWTLTHKLRPRVASAPAANVLLSASADQVERVAARRTAYPTDLSIGDLSTRDLLIAPRLRDDATGAVTGLDDAVSALAAGASLFVGGEPGAGKTVLTFLIHQALLQQAVRTPVPVALQELGDGPYDAAAVARVLGVAETDVADVDELLLIVDGVDEVLAGGVAPADVVLMLRDLRGVGPLLVTCRVHEFETDLLGRIDTAMFTRLFTLLPWTFDDFVDFCVRLEAAELVEDAAGLSARVEESDALRSLIGLPLLARMLTFVMTHTGASIENVTDLYSDYLRSLARTVETRLTRIGCADVNVFALWQATSWQVFDQRLLGGDAMDGSVPGRLLGEYGLSPHCAQVVAAGILDYVEVRGRLMARYRHYTFLEYLVASHLANELGERAARGDSRCWDLFRHDLPREIRRHLTRLLLGTPRVSELLVEQFGALCDIGPDTERLVVGNLLAYYLGRLQADVPRLRALLDAEEDPFLKTSLLWALANAGDVETTRGYLDAMANAGDDVLAIYNRGYLLYYYGDIARGNPPYLDEESAVGWDQTRVKTVELLQRPGYRELEPSARRALDLFTLLDFFRFRRALPTDEEREVIRNAVQHLTEDEPILGGLVGTLAAEW